PRVHLAPLLFAVVRGVEAGRLLHPQAVAAGPSLEFLFLVLALERSALQQGDEVLVPLDADPLSPRLGLLQVLVVEWLAGVGLDPPAGLVERADLMGEQRRGCEVGHRSASFTPADTSPSRRTFRLARSRGRNSSSQLEERSSAGGFSVSAIRRANATVPSTDSIGEARPSKTPARSTVSQFAPSSSRSVSTKSIPTTST